MISFLGGIKGWGQSVLVNYTFEGSGLTGATNVTSASGVNPSLTGSSAISYFGGSTTSPTASACFASANNKFFELTLTTTGYNSITIDWNGRTSATTSSWVVTADDGSGYGSTLGTQTLSTSFAAASTINLSSSFNNKSSIKIRWTASVSGSQTIRIDDIVIRGTSSATPSIAISNQHPTAANIAQGSTNNILGIYQLDVTSANATLTGISVTTAGTYTSSDIQTNGFKFWTNSAANLSGATQLGTSQAAVNSGGTVAVSGQSFSISSSTTRYILVTADIAINATTSNTISLASTVFSNITFSSGNKTGTDPVAATNSMTIASCTPENVTSAAGTNGNTQSILSWVNASCQDEIMIVAATATNTATPTGDGTAYTANSIYASGTVIGNGFVVYKGSTSGQTITGLTNGTQYFFKIFTRRGTSWTSGVEVTATPAQVSSATDYFRSNVASGNWATASTWESSVDGNTWMTSTLVPNNNANTITIRNGHNISVTSSITVDQVVIANGGQISVNSTNGTLNINDGTGNDIDIQSGGVLQVTGTATYSSTIIFNGSATMNISGRVTIGDGTGSTTGGGYNSFATAAAAQIIWNNGSIFEWNSSGVTPGASGVTFFPNLASNVVPIFRVSAISGNPGGASSTVINGQLQLASGFSLAWNGNGLKIFRNGITTLGGSSNLSVGTGTGAWQIGDASVGNAEIGGNTATLTLTNSNGISISANCSATLNSNLILSSTLTLNGTLAIGSNTLTLNGPYFAGTVNNLTTTSSSNLVLNCTGTGPFTLPNFTAINNLTVNSASQVYNLNSSPTINGALTLTSGKLNIGANTLTLAGTVSGMSASNCLVTNSAATNSNLVVNGNLGGSVFFDQTTDANRGTLLGTNALNNLTIGTSGNVVIGNKVNLFGALDFGSGNGTLSAGDGLLVFRNTSSGTSRLAAVSGTPTITGAVVVENYINNQSRGWRLMGSPLTSAGSGGTVTPSVQSNWQSNFDYGTTYQNINYGTNFYSPSGTLGMDGITNRHSLLRFRADTLTVGGWTNINTTGVNLFNADAQNAGTSTNPVFFAFVRGDKSVSAVINAGTPQAFKPTTLAAKGRVTYGNKTVSLTGMNNGYAAVGNPFISPVDASNLSFSNIQSSNSIYVWDPTLGSTGLGGYATLSNVDNYGNSGNMTKYLQTGQAFLVQLNGTSGSVTFEEADKVSNFTTTVTGAGNGLKDIFRTKLYFVNSDGSKLLADAHKLVFGANYLKSFDITEDAPKFANGGENLSSKIGSNLLSVDVRPYIQNSDSVFMNFTNTRVANYEFEFDPSNFDATVTSAKLVDRFLNNETPISLSAKTTVPFSVTATAGSNAADRFMVVFNGTGALPNRGFSVTGEKLGTNKVKINWEAVNEFGVKHYELEHSTDGRTFSKINTQVGKNGNVTNSYTYTDNNPANGVNYYRIKTTQNNDIERYSTTITINLSFNTQQSSMVVYPNPVKGNVIGLQLQDMEKGVYSVRLLSIEGKEVYKQQLQVSGNSLSTTISPSTRLAQGTYTLQVVGKNNSYTQKVVVE